MVPMSVLYGIFLFMGVVSLTGNQFFERTRRPRIGPHESPNLGRVGSLAAGIGTA